MEHINHPFPRNFLLLLFNALTRSTLLPWSWEAEIAIKTTSNQTFGCCGTRQGSDALTLSKALVFMVWSFEAEMNSVTFSKERGVGVGNLTAEQYEVVGTGVIPEQSAFSLPSLKDFWATNLLTIELTAVPALQTAHTAAPPPAHEYSQYVLGIILISF